MLGRKRTATRFEEATKAFMSRLGFADVDGGSDQFLLGGVQVDAVGGHEETLLVVECTMREKAGVKPLRDRIKELCGIHATVTDGIHQHRTYSKYRELRLVLATHNIEVRAEDFQFAAQMKPSVYIWDDNFYAYYDELHSRIGTYAKYNLLGEMQIKPCLQSTISVPALSARLGRITAYTFLISPHDLLEVSYVARRERRNERFYQRIVKRDRIAKIAKYVNEGNILPNNLVIAFGEHLNERVEFSAIKKTHDGVCSSGAEVAYGVLDFPRDYRSCWIIDGQHRLYAFVKTDSHLLVPVTAFQHMELEQQCKFFLDINKNQKPVPADLVWDLNGDMIPNQEDGIISRAVKELNERGRLKARIYVPSKGMRRHKGQLKMAGICISIKRAKLASPSTASKTMNPMHRAEPDQLVSSLSRGLDDFFACVERTLPGDWLLGSKGFSLDDGGNSVLIRLFERIVSHCVITGAEYKTELPKYVTPLAQLFTESYPSSAELRTLKQRMSSEGGKDSVVREFVLYVRGRTGDERFGGDIESEIVKKAKGLEASLKLLIRAVMHKKRGATWFQDHVPGDIVSRCERNLKKHGGEDRDRAYLQMTFGDCRKVIETYRDDFYPLFTCERGFGSAKEIDGALDVLSRVRAGATHSLPHDRRATDEQLFSLYVEKFQQCITPVLSQPG